MTEPQPPYGPPPGLDRSGATPQPGYGPAPGYGPPPAGTPGDPWGGAPYGPGSGVPTETSSRAIIALVLAIGAYFALPFLAAIASLVVASGASREIDASGGRLTGRGMVTAAKVLSWVHLAFCVLVVLAVVLLFGVVASSDSTVSG